MSCFASKTGPIKTDQKNGVITRRVAKELMLAALKECCEGTTTTTEAATTEATTTEAADGAPAPIVDTNQILLYNKRGQVLDTVGLHCAPV